MTQRVIQVWLSIQQIEFHCLFDLTWGVGHRLSATIPFPSLLDKQYQAWYNAYLEFYGSLPLQEPESSPPTSSWRGQVDHQGQFQRPLDWQAELVQAEVDFFDQFHQWLHHPQLFDIRAQLASIARELETDKGHVDIFLSANPISLARFPWECWELSEEFATRIPLRIARCSQQLQSPVPKASPSKRKKFRVLAILGDEHGLNFQGDRKVLESTAPLADIEFIGWQPQVSGLSLKQKICDAIAHTDGWDILFFAGHSNEKAITGGELVVGPGQVLSLQQIIPSLQLAQKQGLQLAIFNSCNGMGIANRLLELGFSQVAVMREPIHNQVAHAFLKSFLHHLCQEKDAQDALYDACQDLKHHQAVSYPSAYCLPSLYRHPQTPPFQFKVMGWKDHLQRLRPTRWEAIALSCLLILSGFPAIQNSLLACRLWIQAIYRDSTKQIPEIAERPPITIISIDQESLDQAQIPHRDRNPIDRQYLAQIIDTLVTKQANIIGIDYLLDTPGEPQSSQILAQAFQKGLETHKTWWVFSARVSKNKQVDRVHPQFAKRNWSLSGDASIIFGYLPLPPSLEHCAHLCPLGYLLSLLHLNQKHPPQNLSDLLKIDAQQDLIHEVLPRLEVQTTNQELRRLIQLQQNPITTAGKGISQEWFAPIIDFSIPKDRVYQRIPASQLLYHSPDLDFSQSIVLVGAGSYPQADDTFPQPLAQEYWYKVNHLGAETGRPSKNDRTSLSGVELHGFIAHHFLTQHLVRPIPDFLLILAIALFLKLCQQGYLRVTPQTRSKQVSFAYLMGYLGVSVCALQVFLSVAIILPWLFPSLTMGVYFLPELWGKSNGSQSQTNFGV